MNEFDYDNDFLMADFFATQEDAEMDAFMNDVWLHTCEDASIAAEEYAEKHGYQNGDDDELYN